MGKRKKARIVAIVAALTGAFGVYFFISLYPRIPDFPQCVVPQDEQEKVIETLFEKTKDFKPTVDEEKIIANLEQLHKVEASSSSQTANNYEETMASIATVRESVSTLAGMGRERYLLLGDYLAREFHTILMDFLSSTQKKGLLSSQARDKGAEEVIRSGGAFISRSLRCGAISSNGELNTSKITPEVLFKVRWRHLADLRLDLDLSNPERKAYHGFVAQYAEKSSSSRRLQAIQELKKLCPSYDSLLARAIVMHEGGNDPRAIQELEIAVKEGMGNSKIRSLLRALRK